MTVNEMLRYGRDALKAVEIDNGANEAAYLMEALLKVDRNFLFLHGDDTLTPENERTYRSWIERRASHYPMQYILGEQPFMDFTFYVNDQVLIPRQDTEILVEQARKRLTSDMQVLDLCCGSGCIGLSLAKYTGAQVTLADISKGALAVTEENRRRLDVADARIVCSDLFADLTGTYDMIVSNPPYIKSEVIPTLMPEVREYEPMLALDGREDGLYFYREIVKKAGAYLNEGGYLCFEIGYDQGDDLRQILVDAHYEDVEIVRDLAGLCRVALGRRGM